MILLPQGLRYTADLGCSAVLSDTSAGLSLLAQRRLLPPGLSRTVQREVLRAHRARPLHTAGLSLFGGRQNGEKIRCD